MHGERVVLVCAKTWRGCLGDLGEHPPIMQVCTKDERRLEPEVVKLGKRYYVLFTQFGCLSRVG